MTIHLLPLPKRVDNRGGVFNLDGKKPILISGFSAEEGFPAARIIVEAMLDRGIVPPPIARAPGGSEPASISLAREPGHPSEGYRIDVTPDAIVLGASTPMGLFHAARTFLQIVMQAGREIPCLTITDSPDFEVRGFYHDISRGKVPTLATMKLIVEKASRYKLNQVQFYVEHVFAFRTHPAIWKGMDTITPEEVLELDEYARSMHVDLVPSLASFGHMYEILQNPVYSHLAEIRNFDTSKQPLWKNRMEYHTIDISNEESYTLLAGLFDDYLPNFSSPWFNICCDETWYLGMDRNKERAGREGQGELYLGHVLRLCEMVRDRGRKVMMWGDILVKYPDLIDRLPPDVVLLNWEYGSMVTEKQSALFGSRNRVYYNCPGVWGWSKFANTIDSGCKNIRKMIDYGARYGAKGIINTDWGDYGHINALAGSFHGMVLGSALSWNTGGPDDQSFDRAVSRVEFSDTTEMTASLLRELGGLHTRWRILMEGINGITPQMLKQVPDDLIALTCRRAPEIEREFIAIRKKAPTSKRIDYDEFIWSARATALNGRLALLAKRRIAKKLGRKNAAELREFARSVRRLSKEFEVLWHARNKESELFRITEVFHRIAKEAEDIAAG